jgi:hypothetical protein
MIATSQKVRRTKDIANDSDKLEGGHEGLADSGDKSEGERLCESLTNGGDKSEGGDPRDEGHECREGRGHEGKEGLNTGVARYNNDTGGDPDTYDTQHEAEGHDSNGSTQNEAEGHDGNGSAQNEAEGHDGNGTQNDTGHERGTPLN